MISPVEAWTMLRTGLRGNLTPETLHLWQLNRLREIVAFARDNSRFYREKFRHINPGSALLDELPFTWPDEIAGDPLAFLCVPQSQVARVTTLVTSGTGGTPKRIAFTEADLLRTVDFFDYGMRTLVSSGQNVLILMSGETENSIGRLLQTALSRINVSARIGGRGWTVHDALAAARTADCLVGIPGEIIYMCRTDRSLRPKSVLLSTDYVPRSIIEGIGDAWGCPVFTHYGMTETGYGCAVQCESREGHHLRDADLIVEIIDPETGMRLAPGERGEIVITMLRSEAMPLIRYRTGDLAQIVARPCACGGVLPRLGRVEGRRENTIRLDDGQTLSIHQLDDILFALPAVRGFSAKLVSDGKENRLILTVEADGGLDEKLAATRLPGHLKTEVRAAEVNPFSRRGKRRIEIYGEK